MALPERTLEIISLFEQGWPLARIGDRFDLTESRISQILTKAGHSGKARQLARHEAKLEAERRRTEDRARVRSECDTDLAARWVAGQSTADIGAALGLDPSIVGRRAKAMGLSQRTRGGWGSSRQSPLPGAHHLTTALSDSNSPERIERLRVQRVVRAELRAERTANASTPTCFCGGPIETRCLCEVGCCEDHAVMTIDGPRCRTCMAAS